MTATPARAQLNPDHTAVLVVGLVVLGLIAAAAFTLSFAGLSAVAPWAAVPAHLAWLVPVFVELAIIGYVVAAYVHHARGEKTGGPWAWAWLWTLVSAGANAAHAWADGTVTGWQGIVGAGLAALFPFATLIAAHVIARLVLAPPEPVDAPVPDPVHPPVPADLLRTVPLRPVRTGPVVLPTRQLTTAERDAEIVRLSREENLTVRAIAARLEVGKTTVANVLNRQGAPA